METKSPFLTEIGGVVDEYDYSGMSPDDVKGLGDSSISLDSIMKKPDALKSAGGFGDMFSGENMQGFGSIAQAAAGIYDAHNRKVYQDKVFKMEEDRVNRANTKEDKQQAAYEKVFG